MRSFAVDKRPCRSGAATRSARGVAALATSHQQPTPRRASAPAETHAWTMQRPFLRGLDPLLDQVAMLQRIFSSSAAAELEAPAGPTPQQTYEQLLLKADDRTFNAPTGQLNGRAGRRSTLEDGERMLSRCIEMQPTDMRPRVLLLRNIMLQNMGRERDVPVLALKTLQEAGVAHCDVSWPASIPVLQTVLLGLKALHKMERADAVPGFVATAQQAVPGLAADVCRLAKGLAETLGGLDAEARLVLLAKRSFLSCVNLQLVAGGTMQGNPQKADVGISWD